MIIRALDIDGDWKLGKGRSDFNRNLDALKANIRTRLKSWRGDCFFAPAEGVDYNNFLDVGTKVFLDNDVKRVILQSDGVIKIKSFTSEIDRSPRAYSATAEVTTIYGDVEIEV